MVPILKTRKKLPRLELARRTDHAAQKLADFLVPQGARDRALAERVPDLEKKLIDGGQAIIVVPPEPSEDTPISGPEADRVVRKAGIQAGAESVEATAAKVGIYNGFFPESPIAGATFAFVDLFSTAFLPHTSGEGMATRVGLKLRVMKHVFAELVRKSLPIQAVNLLTGNTALTYLAGGVTMAKMGRKTAIDDAEDEDRAVTPAEITKSVAEKVVVGMGSMTLSNFLGKGLNQLITGAGLDAAANHVRNVQEFMSLSNPASYAVWGGLATAMVVGKRYKARREARREGSENSHKGTLQKNRVNGRKRNAVNKPRDHRIQRRFWRSTPGRWINQNAQRRRNAKRASAGAVVAGAATVGAIAVSNKDRLADVAAGAWRSITELSPQPINDYAVAEGTARLAEIASNPAVTHSAVALGGAVTLAAAQRTWKRLSRG